MLTQERVRELYVYKDGGLYWRHSWRNRKQGQLAGSVGNHGYRRVKIDNMEYLTHRAIFVYHFGYSPENEIDHIDRNKLNNNVENLREVSAQCNSRNQKNRVDNDSGVKGVFFNKQTERWRAYIAISGEQCYLGEHQNMCEAVAHRLAAEQCVNWSGCNSSSSAHEYMKSHLDGCGI